MIPRVNVAVNAAFFALLVWMYGGDVADAVRAQSAEVSAMTSIPSIPFGVAMLVLTAIGGGLTAQGLRRKRDGTWKGYRVMPIIAVLGLSFDWFVLQADKNHFPTMTRAVATIEVLERRAGELATGAAVSNDPAALDKLVEELGEPPWLAKGEPIAKWTLKVIDGCTGPKAESSGAGAGTIFYCVAADRAQAWITVVGLPMGQRFGPPQIVSAGGQPLVGTVQIRPPESAQEPGEGPLSPEPPAMYFDADAGNLPPGP